MKRCRAVVDVGRRNFLTGAAAAAAGAAATTLLPSAPQAAPSTFAGSYPSNRLANAKDLKVDQPLEVTYPDVQAPGVLLKLGKAVPGGVGPDNDIVGFTTVCPHKGFPLAYNAADHTLNCPGHYARYDCDAGGLQIWGHSTENLPQYMLRVDEKGDIYAEGLDELLYGRLANVL